MRDVLDGIILGAVQGLTEFLPVSSSGHLALLQAIGIGKESLIFNLMLHLATLLAVLIVFRKQVWHLIKHPTSPEMRFLLIASIPTAIIAALVRYFIPMSAKMLPFFFLTTAVILMLPYLFKPKVTFTVSESLGRRGFFKALIVGTAQGIASIGGISRSGTTVTALRLCGADAEESTRTSFLLSIPIIVASAIVEALTTKSTPFSPYALVFGMAAAFLLGLLAVKTFCKIMKSNRLWVFSIYLVAVAVFAFLVLK